MSKPIDEEEQLDHPINEQVDGFYAVQIDEKIHKLELALSQKTAQCAALENKCILLKKRLIHSRQSKTREAKAFAAIQSRSIEERFILQLQAKDNDIATLKEHYDHHEHMYFNQVQRQSEVIQQLNDQLNGLQLQLDRYTGIDAHERELQLIKDYEETFISNNFGRPIPNYIKQMITDGISGAFIAEQATRPLTISKVVMELRRYRLDYNALIRIGMKTSDRYLSLHGTRPRKYVRTVRGNAQIDVNIYFEDDREIIIEAIEAFERENPNYSVF